MATKTIDATLFASSHPDIAKRTSVSGLLISLAMMVAGEAGDDKVDTAVVADCFQHSACQQGDDDKFAHTVDGTWRYYKDGELSFSYTWNDTKDNPHKAIPFDGW